MYHAGLIFGRKFLYCDNEMTDSCSTEEQYVMYGLKYNDILGPWNFILISTCLSYS